MLYRVLACCGALAICGCGDVVMSTQQTGGCAGEGDTGGIGGSPGGAGAGGYSGGAAGSTSGCATDADCGPWETPECGKMICDSGQCRLDAFPADYTCSSPDPDGPGPWPPQPGVFHCWGGQCCFGCIVDNGGTTSELDPGDGPCVAGTDNDFCGQDGNLCDNCTIKGLKCVAGQCASACGSWSDCPTPMGECLLPTCVNGLCGVTAAPNGSLCTGSGPSGMGVCYDGVCGT